MAQAEKRRQWLRLAGTTQGWRCFGGRRERLRRATKNDVILLLGLARRDGKAIEPGGNWYPATALPTCLVETEREDAFQKLAMRAGGKFHASVLLAREWVRERMGMVPTGRWTCLDGGELVPAGYGPVLGDESAGLPVLAATTWRVKGLRPSRPVAFSGGLDEKSGEVLRIGFEVEKAQAARLARVSWTLVPGEPRGEDPDRSLRLIRIPPGPWEHWLGAAELELERRGVVLEPALEVWEEWLAYLAKLGRNLDRAVPIAEALLQHANALGPVRRDPRWVTIAFRIRCELGGVLRHRGRPSEARGIVDEALRLARQHRLVLDLTQRARLNAGVLQLLIDLGSDSAPVDVVRHLQRVAKSDDASEEARLRALGALAEWMVFKHCCGSRRDRTLVRHAERLLRIKGEMEEASRRRTRSRLKRSDGQLASLFSLSGEWDRVPSALERLRKTGRRPPDEDWENWRYQACYAARWLAHQRLVGRTVPETWEKWWRRVGKPLREDFHTTHEKHLEASLERSSLVLDGSEGWTAEREGELARFFSDLERSAQKNEQDWVHAWGFAAAAAWLARRWGLEFATRWQERARACLGPLDEWYGRRRHLARLTDGLAVEDAVRDRSARGFEAILRAVLY